MTSQIWHIVAIKTNIAKVNFDNGAAADGNDYDQSDNVDAADGNDYDQSDDVADTGLQHGAGQ